MIVSCYSFIIVIFKLSVPLSTYNTSEYLHNLRNVEHQLNQFNIKYSNNKIITSYYIKLTFLYVKNVKKNLTKIAFNTNIKINARWKCFYYIF